MDITEIKMPSDFWKFFKSVRLTIVLLILMIVFCVAGSLIAQQATTQAPLESLYSSTTLKWLTAFGLTDVFHSTVFIFLLLMLALNLLACSFDRLPKIWKQTFHIPPPPVHDPFLKDWNHEGLRKQKFLIEKVLTKDIKTLPKNLQDTNSTQCSEAKMVTQLFFQKYFNQRIGWTPIRHNTKYTLLKDHPDYFQIVVEKGKYSRLGVYITHLSLLLIFLGGVIGALFGFEGAMSIKEGTQVNWIQHNRGSHYNLKPLYEDGKLAPGFLDLGFSIACEKFTLETYDGSRPKAFRSKLQFYENGKKTVSTVLEVNHPFEYKGITFYQASYSELGIGAVDLKVYRNKKHYPQGPSIEKAGNIKLEELYRVDQAAGFRVVEAHPNVMDLGPAIKLQFFPTKQTKKPQEFWIFQNLPGYDFAHRKNSPLHFTLDKVNPLYSTGLSVARDPGVWIVWIGSGILVLALFIALYTCHSRYWVAYTQNEGFILIGWSNKLFLFEPKFEIFLKKFTEHLYEANATSYNEGVKV